MIRAARGVSPFIVLLAVALPADAAWYTAQPQGRVTSAGEKVFVCEAVKGTPNGLVRDVTNAGGSYEILFRQTGNNGQLSAVGIAVTLPNGQQQAYSFFQNETVCRESVRQVEGMAVE